MKRTEEQRPAHEPSLAQRGFTLVELMVVIVLLAIIAAVAAPGLQNLLENNQITSTSNRLVGSMNFARSQALREGRQVTVQALDGDWNKGAEVVMGGDVLRRVEISNSRMSITGESVTYRGNGLTTGSSTKQLRLCGDDGSADRLIEVTLGGQVTTEQKSCP